MRLADETCVRRLIQRAGSRDIALSLIFALVVYNTIAAAPIVGRGSAPKIEMKRKKSRRDGIGIPTPCALLISRNLVSDRRRFTGTRRRYLSNLRTYGTVMARTRPLPRKIARFLVGRAAKPRERNSRRV